MSFDFGFICPGELFTMLAIALVCTLSGFFRFRNFRGFGFHLTIAMECIYLLTLCFYRDAGKDAASICGVLFLLAFLLYALFEMVSDYFANKFGATDAEVEAEHVSIWKSILVWPLLSVLYTLLFAPFLYRALMGGTEPHVMNFPIDGGRVLVVTLYSYTLMACTAAVWLLFLIIRKQSSSDAKVAETGKFRMTGLRRLVRYPKELATILFFLVLFFSHFMTALIFPELFILPAVAHVAMIVLQLVEVAKKEKADDVTYGGDEDYRQFVTYTPVLLPLIPWNSFQKKHHWEE